MSEMKIGGFTLAELRRIQVAVQQDASKVIAEATAKAVASINDIIVVAKEVDCELSTEQYAQVQALVDTAKDNLDIAKLVSGLSGVQYYMPYSEEYRSVQLGLFDPLEELYEYLEGIEGIDEMMRKLSEMERDMYLWNSSSIGC